MGGAVALFDPVDDAIGGAPSAVTSGERPEQRLLDHAFAAAVYRRAYHMERMLSCLDLGTMASEDLCGEDRNSSGRLAEAS